VKRSRLLEELIAITEQAINLDDNRPTLEGCINIHEPITVRALLSVSEKQVLELQHLTKLQSALATKAQDSLFKAMALPSCRFAQAFLGRKLDRDYLVMLCAKVVEWLENIKQCNMATEAIFQDTIKQLRSEDPNAIVAAE